MNCEEIREALWNDRDCQFFEYHGRECIIHPFHGGYELWYGKSGARWKRRRTFSGCPCSMGGHWKKSPGKSGTMVPVTKYERRQKRERGGLSRFCL